MSFGNLVVLFSSRQLYAAGSLLFGLLVYVFLWQDTMLMEEEIVPSIYFWLPFLLMGCVQVLMIAKVRMQVLNITALASMFLNIRVDWVGTLTINEHIPSLSEIVVVTTFFLWECIVLIDLAGQFDDKDEQIRNYTVKRFIKAFRFL